jgi:putative hydrolase of the HAD superfamily
MNQKNQVTTLFLDISGVLLSDGWDRCSREEATKLFKLNHDEVEERHHINFETYELGKMTLKENLNHVIFYEKRNFCQEEFISYMYDQSIPFPKMIALFAQLKQDYNLKIAAISNEGRELNEYRIKKFKLNHFIDFFISSSVVNLRKPDAAIFCLALDIAQVKPAESIYIDNQAMFVNIAQDFGMKGICHINDDATIAELKKFGLSKTHPDYG